MMPLVKKLILAALLGSLLVFAAAVPLPVLVLRDSSGKILQKIYLSPGDFFTLRYIHSVEKTPVEDEYRCVGDRIRLWEERTISHNAGLPTEAPRNGRFIMGKNWMHVRGGGYSFPMVRYRVGNEILGRNLLLLSGGKKIDLFEKYPLSVIEFSIGR